MSRRLDNLESGTVEDVDEAEAAKDEVGEVGDKRPRTVEQMSVPNFIVPDKRKVKFICHLIIHEITALPYIAGQYFAKWKLSKTTQKGNTERATISENRVVWNAGFSIECTMVIGKDGFLQPFELTITVKQEINGGMSSEKLGYVTICLANLAGSGSSTTRYLLQEAKSNSLLKVSIDMTLVKGNTTTFKIPPPSPKTLLPMTANEVAEEQLGGKLPMRRDMSLEPNPIRFSIEQLNIIDPETKDSELVDSFFAQAEAS
ncbi:hypothetical protein HDV03_001859 [Kappamyces sp. JEL0829]|nr:hypothetical protein HDV03_001859 [Kappamyces sp. JEL0829]